MRVDVFVAAATVRLQVQVGGSELSVPGATGSVRFWRSPEAGRRSLVRELAVVSG